MRSPHTSELPTATDAKPARRATHALMTAALAGLAAGAFSCGDEGDTVAPTDEAEEEPRVTSTTKDESVRIATFTAECQAEGGFVQVHAVCSGNNACRGFSYNKYSYERVEHTCKGTNTCGGMSCVFAADGEGRDAKAFYDESCAGCHGAGSFKLFEPPGADLEAERDAFAQKSDEHLAKLVAFGTGLVTPDGTYMTSMPAHYETLSRAEIVALVAHLKTLPIVSEAYGIVGEGEEIGDQVE
jgi:hypothetical protein